MSLRLITILIVSLLTISSCGKKNANNEHIHDSNVSTSTPEVDTLKKSIPKEEHLQIGNAHVMIKYHAPAVRGRAIWGGLVPNGEVWVTGAHNATSFEIDKNFIVNEQEIPAGKYALFTIPDKDNWTIILNKNWDQHLADEYDQYDDVIRFAVKPEFAEQIQERLKYSVEATGDSAGTIHIRWEKVHVSFPLKVN